MIRIKRVFESESQIQEIFELRYFAFDWDDNILRMGTKILMDQKVGEDWLPVEVSTSRFAEVRNDPDYRIRNGSIQEAFSEFRDNGPRAKSAFLEDVIEAYSNGRTAASWNNFLQCLSVGAIFSIITARGHEDETIREGVEWIIDNVLAKTPSKNPGRTLADDMFQNLKMYMYLFEKGHVAESELTGTPSKNSLVREYLDHCNFWGVSSESFARDFGLGSAQSPEVSKMQALNVAIDDCIEFGKQLQDIFYRNGINKKVVVKFGMSDDDPKTSSHIKDYFNEKKENGLSAILYYYQTTNPEIEGGEMTKFEAKRFRNNLNKKVNESSNRAVGLDSSVTSMMPQTSLSQRFFTNTKDAADSMHKQSINFNGLARDLYSKFGKTANESQPKKFKKKKKVVKKLKSFESYMETEKSREEMILQLCNSGYERWELDTCSDLKLKEMCREVPEETVSEKRKVTKRIKR
jgi:hypothetical protein